MSGAVLVAIAASIGNLLQGWDNATIAGKFLSFYFLLGALFDAKYFTFLFVCAYDAEIVYKFILCSESQLGFFTDYGGLWRCSI